MNTLLQSIMLLSLFTPQTTAEVLFGSEYKVIKQAADRNQCYGDDFIILLAIRKAENGRKGLEFGVMHPRAIDTNLDIQAGWCAATIVKNRVRWERRLYWRAGEPARAPSP